MALAIIAEQNRRTFVALDEASSEHEGMEGLIWGARAIADQLLTDPIVRAGIRLSLDQGTLSAPTGEFYRQWIDSVAELVRQARAAGELRGDLSADRLARLMVAFFTGSHMVSNVLSGRDDLYQMMHETVDVVLSGIAASEHAGRLMAVLDQAFAGPQPLPVVHPSTPK